MTAELTETVRGEIEDLRRGTFAPATPPALLAEHRWPAGKTHPFANALGALLTFTDRTISDAAAWRPSAIASCMAGPIIPRRK
jgi:hypothetical protein